MSLRLYVPGDAAALAVGADAVAAGIAAQAAARYIQIEIVRNGSRGAFELETLVEVESAQGRIGYGPIDPHDVAGLADALFVGGPHPKRLGRPEDLPFFARTLHLERARAPLPPGES